MWFFNSEKPEITLKMIDGCGPFGHFWVFASGLTDVEVTLTVTDTQTGTQRTYFNPQKKQFAPVLDTSAFDTCL